MKNFRFIILIMVITSFTVFTHCDSTEKNDDLSQLALLTAIAGSYSDIQLSSIVPASGNTNYHILNTNIQITFDGALDTTVKGSVKIGDITFEDGVNCTITFIGSDQIDINPDDDFEDLSQYQGLKIRNFKDAANKTVIITDAEYSLGFKMV